MKKTFEEAELEVILFNAEDVTVDTSGGFNGDDEDALDDE